jgi:hypothetical protein
LLRRAAIGFVVFGVAAAAPVASAQIYKCQDSEGRTTYSDSPCGRDSRLVKIPDNAPALPPGSTVCAQLKDELNRLAANEAARASPSKRRAALYRTYSERCAGISRVPPDRR